MKIKYFILIILIGVFYSSSEKIVYRDFKQNGRLEALKEIKDRGFLKPNGITSQKDIWYVPTIRNVSFEDDQEAEAYIIADNRLVELGGWDSDKLDQMLIDLKKSGQRSMDGIGFTELDITKLKNSNFQNGKAFCIDLHAACHFFFLM